MEAENKLPDIDLNSPELEIFSNTIPQKTSNKSGWQELLDKGYVRAVITLSLLITLFGSTFFIASRIRKPSFVTTSANIGYIPQAKIDIPQPKVVKSCSEINSPEETSFLNSYCQGNFCVNHKDKESCESVDVLVVKKELLSEETGQDGLSDCIWSEEEMCAPKY